MPGGLIQLQAYGEEDAYLHGNPQASHFRAQFQSHTNFAMEMVRVFLHAPSAQQVIRNETKEGGEGVKLTCRLDRSGDLVSSIYLVFTLPDIYSGYNPAVSDANFARAGYRLPMDPCDRLPRGETHAAADRVHHRERGIRRLDPDLARAVRTGRSRRVP